MARLNALARRIASVFALLWLGIRITVVKIWTLLFGKVAWTPPVWIGWPARHVARGARAGSRASVRWKRSSPKRFWLAMAGLAVACGAGFAGYRYYKSLPEPVRLTMVAAAPALVAVTDPDQKPRPISITFSGSAARLEDVGKPVDKGVVIDPALTGQWQFVSDRELVFTPAADWAIGKEYTVKLEKRLFPSHVLLAAYETKFTTPKFHATLDRAEFYQDPTDAKRKLLSMALSFTHPVDRASLEKSVKIVRKAKRADGSENGPGKDEFAAKITYGELDGKVFIASEDIPLPERDVELEVDIGPEVRAAKGSDPAGPLHARLTVPAVGSFFRVSDLQVSYVRRDDSGELVPILTVAFTGRVSPKLIAEKIEAWVLPTDRPKTKAHPDAVFSKNHHWSSPSEVDAEILALGRKLPLVADGDPGAEPSGLLAFKHAAKPGESIYVRLPRGIEAFGGYILAEEWAKVAKVPSFPIELKILHPGAILSMVGEKKLTIVSRGVPGFRARLGRVPPDRLNHLISATRGNFASPEFQTYNFGRDDLVERFEQKVTLDASDPGKPQYHGLDMAPYLSRSTGASSRSDKRGLFFVDIDAWDPTQEPAEAPKTKEEETNRKGDPNNPGRERRFVLVTDLGIVVKDAVDDTHEVFVMKFKDGVPAQGVEVTVLGRNGIPLVSKTTDAQGRASFPSFEGFRYEEAPVAWVAKSGEDVSFLPFGRYDRQLSLSRFDIGGETMRGKKDTLDAYLFSDRGLYRPGEEVRIGTIVKTQSFAPLPDAMPLELVINDPRGLEIVKRKYAPGAAGFDEHTFSTEATSPTGIYEIALYTVRDQFRGALLGQTSIKVEEFLPDRLKISAKLSAQAEVGWVKPEKLTAEVTLKNLHGTPAVGHRVAGSYTLAPAAPKLPGYDDWNFMPLDMATEAREEELGDQTSDAEGHAVFTLPVEKFEGKTYRLTFTGDGFELAGGRSVSGRASTVVSSRDFVIGTKPDGDLNWIRQGTDRRVAIIALGADAKPKTVPGLSAVLSERRYVSTLVKSEDGLFRYRSTEVVTTLSTTPLEMSEAGFKYKLPAAKAGSFIYEVKNEKAEVLAAFAFEVAGSGALARGLERNAELTIKLAKQDVAPGDEIELELRAPYTGSGLITIERDKVYAAQWFKADQPTSIQKIKMPEGIEGNAYVHVAFVRAADSRELYASPLSYGVQPITVSRARRTITIDLKVPEKTKPQDLLKVAVKPDRQTRMVVFGVDEGILQVAKYKTPDPLSRFLRKRALEVSTRQILDQILPEFSVAMKAAAGGDGDDALARNLNPFRRRTLAPAVFWSGIIEVGPEGMTVDMPLPSHFNGTVRVMAVAVSDDAIGASETRTLRQGPFVLSPVAPLFVAPGDEFQASVAVANNVVGSGADAKISVALAPSANLSLVGEKTQVLTIAEGREGTATFKLKAAGPLGEGQMGFAATMGAETVGYEETLSVRPASPYEVQVAAKKIASGSDEIEIERQMFGEFRKLETTVAHMPLGLARGLIAYLEGYPHGCTEQVLSQSFPSVLLASKPEFGIPIDKAKLAVERGIDVLRARQNADGSVGYWAANADVIPFQNAYAAHFLIEAKEHQIGAPDAALAMLVKYLTVRVEAADPRAKVGVARDYAYAAYVLARDGQLTGNMLSKLKEVFEKNLPEGWKNDATAAFLAAAMKLRKDDDEAWKIMKKVTTDGKNEADGSFYYDTYLRAAERLYIMAKHFPEHLGEDDAKAAERLVDLVVSSRYNTLTSAWAILALEAYSKIAGVPKDNGVTIVATDRKKAKAPLEIPAGPFPIVPFGDQVVRLDFDTGQAKLPLYVSVTTAGFDLEDTRKPETKGIEVFREILNAKQELTDEVEVGDEVTVNVVVRAIDAPRPNVAIIDILPGGFELDFESIPGRGRGAGRQPGETQDGEAEPEAAPPPEETPAEHGQMQDEYRPEAEGEGEGDDAAWLDWSFGGKAYAKGSAAKAAPPFQARHVDLREDRIVLYGDVPKDVTVFTYKLKATAPGTYVVPAAYATSMYDREIRTRGKASKITIKAKG